jgi:chitinase
MKQYILKLKMLCLLVLLLSCGKSTVNAEAPDEGDPPKKDFFVIGYMFADANLLTASAKIDFNKITHLNIAFINPDATGKFIAPTGLQELVNKAHDKKVKVIAAIGGGSPPEHLKALLPPGNRKVLIDNLMSLVNTYQLDGVDVDLEGDFINEYYEGFVVEMSAALKKEKKMMTAAVATWNSAAYSNKAIALFDLINIMSYDQTGPWRKENPGPHSTYEAAEMDFKHWNINRGIPVSKLILGLPFYGYGFGSDIMESISYGDLVKNYPGSAEVDLWELPGKGIFYYNGMPTIRKKVAFSLKNNAGGVMIWQLLGDAEGANSLLTAIYDDIK